MRRTGTRIRRSLSAPLGLLLGLSLVQCTAAQPPPPAPPPAAAPSSASVLPVTAARLGASWRPGCPVAPEQLRLLRLVHVGMDGRDHVGELVVAADRVPQVITAFDQLHRLRYPIERMRTPEHYANAEDELSMRDDNTSAFSCRGIDGSNRWSEHAKGRAVDVNPLINPYRGSSGELQPQTAGQYLDRTRRDPGLLHDGDPAVRVFTDHGWTWGGHWRSPTDYQHFELP